MFQTQRKVKFLLVLDMTEIFQYKFTTTLSVIFGN